MSFIQATPVVDAPNTVSSVNLVFGSNVTLNDTILVATIWDKNDGSAPVPTDPHNSYTLLQSWSPAPGTSLLSIAIYAARVTVSGALTVLLTTGNVRGGGVACEYSGLQAIVSLLDEFVAAGQSGFSGTLSSGNIPSPTDTANELLFSVYGSFFGQSATNGSGYNTRATGNTDLSGMLMVQDKEVSSTGTYAATAAVASNTNFNGIALVTLREVPPTFSISGSAGQAGATVYWTADDFSSSGSVTADGSGNYTITGLSNGRYWVVPAKVGFTFSTAQEPTISGGNVTGINFTATSIPTLFFTQLAAETFTEANRNPLNPANWTIATGLVALQVVSNTCRSTGTPGTDDGSENYTGTSFPANQYMEVHISALTGDASSEVALSLLADSTGLGPGISISNNGDGTATFAIFDAADDFLFVAALPFSVGDVWRVANLVDQIIVYQNGTQVAGSTAASSPASGSPNLFLSPASSLTDVELINFAAGRVDTGASISGNAGRAGATVSYTGTASGSVTADGSGNYTIFNLANGSYTITPTLTGYVFTPTNRSETVSGSNITGVDFTAAKAAGKGDLDYDFRIRF